MVAKTFCTGRDCSAWFLPCVRPERALQLSTATCQYPKDFSEDVSGVEVVQLGCVPNQATRVVSKLPCVRTADAQR